MKDTLAAFALPKDLSGVWTTEWSSRESSKCFSSLSPIDGAELGRVRGAESADYEGVVAAARASFERWRLVPAPQRGQVVREIAQALREKKSQLGKLVTLETGKILAEGEGEIQEAIDIADFAVGLSRQLYGKAMHSERPAHRMYEQWHPLGPVGVITAFNFPVAVWAWNAMIAAVCGDVVIWKPSEFAPLSAIATIAICNEVTTRHGFPGLFTLLAGDGPEMGKLLAADRRIPLISATGSTAMGRAVGEVVARRLGRTILELGGNNGVLVLKDADLDMAVRSTLFGAVGTAGQRCTTTRRLIAERAIANELRERLLKAYAQVRIGDPRVSGTLMGPLINQRAVETYRAALARIASEGGKILCGGTVLTGMPSPLYVEPTIVAAHRRMAIVQEETFVPILYLLEVENLEEAIEVHNEVGQGLSSAVFTRSLQSAERFLAATGSDCGIANVNIGTSGAEIGGAFGGEKESGGGREAGSDCWKQYMRRQTNTINWSTELPLAQGIKFE